VTNRGATTSSKLGSSSLVWGITTLLQKKIRQVYPVWCNRLIIRLFTKKLRENLGVRPNFGGPDPSPVVAPMVTKRLRLVLGLHSVSVLVKKRRTLDGLFIA